MNNYRRLYERLRQNNPNVSDDQLRRQAWVMNDRQIFEVNSTLAPSSSSAGSGGGTLPSRRAFVCNPVGGITISLGINPNFFDIDGVGKIYFEYDGLYNDRESFVYRQQPDDSYYDWTVRFNTESNLWELNQVDFGVVAQSSVSAYSGWEINIEAFLGISIECGNKNIRNICGTSVSETTTRSNSWEIFPVDGGLIYTILSYESTIALIGNVWYFFTEDSFELGGDAENFPYGTYEIDGVTVTLDEGSCPIL